MDNYGLLIQKLDAFIRKYYLNRLIKGLLIFIACLLGIFLLLNIGEYFFYFPAIIKISLLLCFGIAAIFALIVWIIRPLLKMQRLGNIISHDQAAQIIGQHFPNIADKLLNVLQLKHGQYPEESWALVAAGIEQKTSNIIVIPFLSAINLKKNRKYLPYILGSVILIALIAFIVPNLFTTATSRLMQPTVNFSEPAPFTFSILNKDLSVPLNGNYELKIKVDGDKLPNQVFVSIGNELLEMQKNNKNEFSYAFQNVNKPVHFNLKAAKVESPDYLLNIIEKPYPLGFTMDIIYPAYTKIANQKLQSMTDVVVPEGTLLKWSVQTKYTDKVSMKFGNNASEIVLNSNDLSDWNYGLTLMKDTTYSIYLSNKQIPHADSFSYRAQVILDQKPQVVLQQFKDSISGQQIVLNGQASDDYGLTSLNFIYEVYNHDKVKIKEKKIPLKLTAGKISSFQYYFDAATVQLQPGEEVTYFVDAWDNDAIHGSKRGVSEQYTYRMPDKKELDSIMQQNAVQMNQSLSSSAKQSKSINKDLEKLQTQILQNEGGSWEQEQNMKSMLDKQTQLKDQVAALKKRFEQQEKQSEQKNFSEPIKEKQAAIQKQLDQLLNKELADQLKKLQDMLEQKNKANAFEDLQKMAQENKLFDKDLERIQAMMKQLEMQMKLEDLANKLADLAKKERQLEQKTANQEKDNKALSKEQSDLKKELAEMMKNDMAAIEKINKEQESPKELSGDKKSGDQAQEDMENSEQQLNKQQNKAAQDAQDKAAQKLEKMSASMAKMASGMDMEQIDIDIKAVRQLLTNLLRFSFDQEALMAREKTMSITSPSFVLNGKTQERLKGNANMIKDSLFTLSKRVFQLAPTINRESAELTANINSSIGFLEDRRVSDARVKQQFAMANANNLALMLDETLSHLMQMQAQASGKGMPKPGKGKPGQGKPGSAGDAMKDIITGQKKLGEGMQKAKDGQGKKPGESGKNGESGAGGEGQAEQLAKLAQQQAQLRQQIQELSSMLNSSGNGGQNAKLLQEIQQEMNKNETDLVNRKLDSKLNIRQKDIVTRMLEAEKSIRNQDEDDKRASTSGKDLPRPMPPELEKYVKSHQEFMDAYKTAPAVLKPFYQKMTDTYLKQVK